MRHRRPAARRALLLGLVVALAVVVTAAPAAAATHPHAEQRLVQKMNAERGARGLGALAVDARLTEIARDWTPRMIADGQLSHRPGADLTRLAPSGWTRLGENVGRTVKSGAGEAELVDRLHDAFMASPGHRDNILGDYRYVGVGIQRSGDGGMWVTVNFMQAPASAHTPLPPEPTAGPQVAEAVRVSRRVFAAAGAGGRQASFAVVGRAEVFADVLGGAALAGDRAPILFTPGPTAANRDPALHPTTRAEIDRVLGARGKVYLLGGTGAVSDRTARELAAAGYTVRRLAGASRVETSVKVADETLRVHGASGRLLLARADQWPDAVTGGAYAAATGTPLLLTTQSKLHPAVAAFLSRHGGTPRFALGGTAALSDGVVRAARAERVAGADRSATAVAIAERLWQRTRASDGDRYATTPGHGDQAWAFALAQAPWTAVNDAPQLLVGNSVPPAVAGYLGRLGYGGAVTGEVMASSAVPGAVLSDFERYLGR